MPDPDWGRGEAGRQRLPRLEDLPRGADGYDREAVADAFDAFYRHAAELDATLAVLESVDAFRREAGDLRADIRALRAAAWGPVPTPRAESWDVGYRRRAATGPVGAVSDAFPRVVVETVFILVVAVGAAVAGLSTPLVILLVVAAWLVVGAIEVTASVAGPRLRRRPVAIAPPAEPAPAPTVVTPQLEAETGEPEPHEAPAEAGETADPSAPGAEPEVGHEPAPGAEPEVGHEPAPGAEAEADPAEAEYEPEPGGEELPVPVAAATPRRDDPWEAGPEIPGLEDGEPQPEERSRLRFWRRRRAPEEAALYAEPSGHVQVISVRPGGEPPQQAAEQAEPLPSAEGWEPPTVERPPAETLRRGRR